MISKLLVISFHLHANQSIETVIEISFKLYDYENIFEENTSNDNSLQSLFVELCQTSLVIFIKIKKMKSFSIIIDMKKEYSKDEQLSCSSVICYLTDLFIDALIIILNKKDKRLKSSLLS